MSADTVAARPLSTFAVTVLTATTALAGACSSDDPGGPTTSRPPTSTTSPCPSATDTAEDWPAAAPPRLPQPPGLQVVAASRQGNVSIIRFTTTEPLTDVARFFVAELPKAGYTLRRGDSEGDEVDQPFSGRGRRASIKLQGVSRCVTHGTLVSQAT